MFSLNKLLSDVVELQQGEETFLDLENADCV